LNDVNEPWLGLAMNNDEIRIRAKKPVSFDLWNFVKHFVISHVNLMGNY